MHPNTDVWNEKDSKIFTLQMSSPLKLGQLFLCDRQKTNRTSINTEKMAISLLIPSIIHDLSITMQSWKI